MLKFNHLYTLWPRIESDRIYGHTTAMTLQDYKKLFHATDKIRLNNAGLSPIARPVFEEIQTWSRRFYEEGPYADPDFKIRMEWSREQVAKLIDADVNDVAFLQSCTWGISQFAFGLKLQPADEIILLSQEYSSNLLPWKEACDKANAKLIKVHSEANKEISLEDLSQHITERTRLITVSWVQYQTGGYIDLEPLSQLCKEKNILLFVDATQALGIHSLSFRKLHIHGLACSSHKWMSAPFGLGFFAIRKDVATQMNPIAVGSDSYLPGKTMEDLTGVLKSNARRFEAGAKQVLEICALGKSAEIINQVGADTLKKEAFRLGGILQMEIEKLGYKINSPFKEQGQSQFVNFSDKKGNNQALLKFLNDSGLHVPIRGPGIRMSPHAFNSENEIDRFIEVLKKY